MKPKKNDYWVIRHREAVAMNTAKAVHYLFLRGCCFASFSLFLPDVVITKNEINNG